MGTRSTAKRKPILTRRYGTLGLPSMLFDNSILPFFLSPLPLSFPSPSLFPFLSFPSLLPSPSPLSRLEIIAITAAADNFVSRKCLEKGSAFVDELEIIVRQGIYLGVPHTFDLGPVPRNFPVSVFLNMRRVLHQNACIAIMLKIGWMVLASLYLTQAVCWIRNGDNKFH